MSGNIRIHSQDYSAPGRFSRLAIQARVASKLLMPDSMEKPPASSLSDMTAPKSFAQQLCAQGKCLIGPGPGLAEAS
ncbi:hypothetical protein PoB_003331900 [Plakobranchus ocellatus]|uniref:Uncharacterized protein n=1 Tax=Plakobranchus ocellatus TaxID=259542 RepID=A0AAV4AGL4_9GAST|nr:hypothetical protein PoB_003331900 [Plakobranchus ocellatus]